MTDSEVIVSRGGTTYAGPDAMLLLKTRVLIASLRLYAKSGIRPSRNVTPTLMLQMAGRITRKTYKRGAYAAAIADLTTWAETMQAALPITIEGETQ